METALEKLSKHELIALLHKEREALRHQDIAIRQHQETLQQQEQILQQKDEILRSKDDMLRSKDEILHSKDEILRSKDEDIVRKQDQVDDLKAQVEQYKRMLFGQKRERFEADSSQLPLPFEPTADQQIQQEEQLTEKIEYVRKKQSASSHKGRVALPAHLPVEEIEIHPQGDLSQMECIGKEITEELECTPAKLFIRRYIRYKYAKKDKEGIAIGELPERVIEKGIPGPGLLASILVDKYVDHLPLYRQRQRFLREKIPIASSTLEGWVRQAIERLEILYDKLLEDIKAKGYLQADETPIKVLESKVKGACHLGYYWVYHSPIDKVVLFDYQPTRKGSAPRQMLKEFKGYLQTDGYSGYKKIALQAGITHLACWAHARREFEKALSNDKARAQVALLLIQKLYAVEATARESQLSPEQRKELRLTQSLPVLNELGKWITREIKQTLPKSKIGKAMAYCTQRWDALNAYLYDGMLEIDNNLVENAIRPVALGRKNYLFAGSHQSAQRAAVIYSLLAICKKHDVNPYQWLKYTLENIMTINHKEVRKLFPQNFSQINTKPQN